jgi:tetratricopeptide (TPR) repeat protein
MKTSGWLVAIAVVIVLADVRLTAQTGDHFLYGDLIVDESKVVGLKTITYDALLYTEGGVLVSRQPVASNGRYRFNNILAGIYYLSIEAENSELVRLRIDLTSPILLDVRRDISLEWRSQNAVRKSEVISAIDNYVRSDANQKLFRSAEEAMEKKQFAKAAEILRQLTLSDSKDFQAWFELANVHYMQNNLTAAEQEYLNSLDAHPGFFLALLNLGRLEILQRRYDIAIAVLSQAIKAQPNSALCNYLLGEGYLQTQKGSIAVVYFTEALRLDPDGMAEAHLRLALLYDRAALKIKAAMEYSAFLKKRPDYKYRRKLQQYIAKNRD